jgi:hypothetical protein
MGYTPRNFIDNWRKNGWKSAWNEDKKVTKESIHSVFTLADVLSISAATTIGTGTFYGLSAAHNAYRLQIPFSEAITQPTPGAIVAAGLGAIFGALHMRGVQNARYGNNLHAWTEEYRQEVYEKKRQLAIERDAAYEREVQAYKINALEQDCDRYQRLAIAGFDKLTDAVSRYEEAKTDEFYAQTPKVMKRKDVHH